MPDKRMYVESAWAKGITPFAELDRKERSARGEGFAGLLGQKLVTPGPSGEMLPLDGSDVGLRVCFGGRSDRNNRGVSGKRRSASGDALLSRLLCQDR